MTRLAHAGQAPGPRAGPRWPVAPGRRRVMRRRQSGAGAAARAAAGASGAPRLAAGWPPPRSGATAPGAVAAWCAACGDRMMSGTATRASQAERGQQVHATTPRSWSSATVRSSMPQARRDAGVGRLFRGARRFQSFEPGRRRRRHSGRPRSSSGARRKIAPDLPIDELERCRPDARRRLASTRPRPRQEPLRVVDNVQHGGLPAARTQIVQGRLQLVRLAGEQIGDEEGGDRGGSDRWA